MKFASLLLANFSVAYQIMAVTLMVMGSSKIRVYVFNFAILLKSRKFVAREMYVLYSTFYNIFKIIIKLAYDFSKTGSMLTSPERTGISKELIIYTISRFASRR